MKKIVVYILLYCFTLFLFAGCADTQPPAETAASSDQILEDELTEEEIILWARGCSAILAERNGLDPYQFGMFAPGETNKVMAQILLMDSWNIKNKSDLRDTIKTMTDYGHNAAFAEDYRVVASMTKKEFDAFVESSEGIDKYMWPMTKALGDYWGDKELKAWDWFRMIHVAGWGYVAGYIKLEESYELMRPVIERLRSTFSSWDEANENYMDGFAWWSRMDPDDPESSYEYIIRMQIYEELKAYPLEFTLFEPSLWPGYVPDEKAEKAAESNFTYENNGDGTCTITGYKWESGSLVIPAEIDGLVVTAIGNRAFFAAKGFSGPLTIPDTVKSIGDRAFEECFGLSGSLTIPDSVTSIGERAFMYCHSLKGDLTLSKNLKELGNTAFSQCTGFSGKLIIPEGVEKIGSSAFYNCENFSGSLILPKSLKEIGKGAFQGCKGFAGVLEIPENLTNISTESAFQNCTGITAIKVSEKNPAYASVEGVLYSKDKKQLLLAPAGMVKTNFSVPDGTTEIGKSAFQDCIGFSGILKMPDGLKKIGEKAFMGCIGLDKIVIPDSVTEIEKVAFSGCRNMKSITIPAGVTKMNGAWLEDCDSLEVAVFLFDAPEKFLPNTFGGSTNKDVKILYDPKRSGWSTPLWNDIPCYPK